MRSSGPPRQGADHGSSNQESGKVQFSRSGLDGATGNKLYDQRDPAQGSALSADLASVEPGPTKGCSPKDAASRSVLDSGIAKEVQFLRSSPSDASGKAHSSNQENRQHHIRLPDRVVPDLRADSFHGNRSPHVEAGDSSSYSNNGTARD